MKPYTVRRDFGSGATGQLYAGDTVDLDPAVAAWVNEQAPGTLVASSKKRGS